MSARSVGIALGLIALLFLALGGIIAARYFLFEREAQEGEVSLYFGKNVYKLDLDPEKAKEIVRRIRELHGVNGTKVIVMFGVTTCPYCKAQEEVFRSTHPELYRPLWVDKEESVSITFNELVEAELKAGAPPQVYGVPHTVVIHGDSIRAIVIGLVREKSFWDELLRD